MRPGVVIRLQLKFAWLSWLLALVSLAMGDFQHFALFAGLCCAHFLGAAVDIRIGELME